MAELPDGVMEPGPAAAIASGMRLRAYRFDRYKTKKKDDENGGLRAQVSLAVDDVAAARKIFAGNGHLVDGIVLARELVNEPPNVLYPEEFARRASQLRKLGVIVEVLDVKAMTKLGMVLRHPDAQDLVSAFKWTLKAANGGDPSAMLFAGFALQAGDGTEVEVPNRPK